MLSIVPVAVTFVMGSIKCSSIIDYNATLGYTSS